MRVSATNIDRQEEKTMTENREDRPFFFVRFDVALIECDGVSRTLAALLEPYRENCLQHVRALRAEIERTAAEWKSRLADYRARPGGADII